MDVWNTICNDILKKKTKQASEKEYQELVCAHFRYLLGWHCERVEINNNIGAIIDFAFAQGYIVEPIK